MANNATATPEDLRADFPFGKPPIMTSELPFFPFRNGSMPVGILARVKIVLMLPIFLVRLLLFILCFIIGYSWTKIVMTGVPANSPNPFPEWRRRLLWPVRLCGRGILFCWGFNWIKVKGKPVPREVAPILVSNHVALGDGIYIFFAHLPMIVSAKENLSIPFAGEIMKALQVIVVDRASASSRKDAAAEIRRRASCNDWPLLAMFPEGTTTNGRSIVSFKCGAFSAGLPVQPMVIRYPHVNLDPAWVAEGPDMGTLIFRMMTQLNSTLEVEYLEMLEPSPREKSEPQLFADRCRLRMARALNVGVTQHSFGDVSLALEAQKLSPPPASGLTNVEFGQLEKMYRMDVRDAKKLLRNFHSMGGHIGTVSLTQFLAFLCLPKCSATKELFGLFCPEHKDSVNFRQYLYFFAFIRHHSRFREAVESLFSFMDSNGDGSLSVENVKNGVSALFSDASDEQMAQVFESMDADKDSKVTWEEFLEFGFSRPEFIAAVLMAQPSLLPPTAEEAVEGKEE